METTSLFRTPEGEKAIMAFYDSVLERWPVPHEELEIDTRLGKTFVIACGEKDQPALVLLHGASSNAASWVGDALEYSSHFRVFAVDTPGDPGKSVQARPAWNSPAYAEWLEDVLNGLHLPEVNLLGISQGGWIALKYAVYQPERIKKLALLAPAGIVADKTSFIVRAVLYSLAGRQGAEAINRMVLGNQSVHEDAIKYMNLILTQFRSRVEIMPLFTDQELKRLIMPVLLIGGRLDAIRNAEKIQARLKLLVPSLQTVIYPDRGHALINLAADCLPFLLG